MNHLKILAVIGMITAFCLSSAWAGSIEITAVDEDRNALIDVTLCGEGVIDEPEIVSSDDTLYILFSASETQSEECATTEKSIPIPPCSEYTKIVALMHSRITLPEAEGINIIKDWSMDSLYVDLDVYTEGCCKEKYEDCISQCDDTEECKATCEDDYEQCMLTDVPEITVDCKPETLNLKSKGNYITCYLTSSDVDGINDIDRSTLQLQYAGTSLSAIRSEFEDDQLMVKFDRQILQALIKITEDQIPVTIELTVSGEQNGKIFEATDTMKVIHPPKKKKKKKKKRKKGKK